MMIAILRRGALLSFLWWILTEGRRDAWVAGFVAIGAALWLSLRLCAPRSTQISVGGLGAFLGYFIWNSVRGGVQVALLALRGRRALHPGTLELQLNLASPAPRIFVANVLALMPGTVSVRLNGKRLRLHVIDERMPIVAEVKALEVLIARMFGERV
ncbi:MAG: Na+/H+ antiporter subunit E [Desulfoarculaceae bacterium]|nr:Na+/H+ antiporter subunit E [Desulfoarculaceae bacterium]